jgi:4-amino-4-deoxy-L-arabinose transferase-like glycosyltransferase/membrane-associated phospholipid phosphatase
MPEWITQWDTGLFLFLNRDCQNRLFDLLMPVITQRWYLIVLPFLLLFLLKERRKALGVFGVVLFSVLLADSLGNVLKSFVARQRPCNVLEGINLLVGCSSSFAMPSNHATNVFAFTVPFLVMTRDRVRYLFLFIAALVALSRVFVGVHYPGDIIGGALTGAFSAGVVMYLYAWAEKRFGDRPYSTVMYMFLFGLSLYRLYYLSFGPLDLSPDEAHYWEWSRRLDLSYYSKGPVIAYLIALSTFVFGDTVFGVRFLAVVLSLLSSIVLYRLGTEMYNERVGAASAILLQIIPLFSAFGVLITIDSPFLFFWILSLYLFWKAVNSSQLSTLSKEGIKQGWLYWFLLGITVGVGLLTKYTMAFFYPCVLCFLVFSADHRKLLRSAGPYGAFLISLMVFSPVVIWNAQHDWITLKHTAGQAHIADGLRISLSSFVEFAGSQVGVVTPVLFVLIFVAIWKVRGRDHDSPGFRAGFLFWFSVPVIVFFLLKSAQGKVQANWAMTGYVTGLIAFSEIFINRWDRNRPAVRSVIVAGIALSLALTAVAYYPAKFRLPVKLDPSARLKGWNDLGQEVRRIYADMRKKGQVFIFSESYQISSELAFYVEGRPVTYCVNLGRRMNQYDLWPDFGSFIHSDGIFVTIGDAELDPRIRSAFHGNEKRVVKVYDKERFLREYSIFLCYDFQGMTKETTGKY